MLLLIATAGFELICIKENAFEQSAPTLIRNKYPLWCSCHFACFPTFSGPCSTSFLNCCKHLLFIHRRIAGPLGCISLGRISSAFHPVDHFMTNLGMDARHAIRALHRLVQEKKPTLPFAMARGFDMSAGAGAGAGVHGGRYGIDWYI